MSIKNGQIAVVWELNKKRNIYGGKVGRCVWLTTFMLRLSWNLGASTSWNPQGLSRPVMGLFYVYILQRLAELQREKDTDRRWLGNYNSWQILRRKKNNFCVSVFTCSEKNSNLYAHNCDDIFLTYLVHIFRTGITLHSDEAREEADDVKSCTYLRLSLLRK